METDKTTDSIKLDSLADLFSSLDGVNGMEVHCLRCDNRHILGDDLGYTYYNCHIVKDVYKVIDMELMYDEFSKLYRFRTYDLATHRGLQICETEETFKFFRCPEHIIENIIEETFNEIYR